MVGTPPRQSSALQVPAGTKLSRQAVKTTLVARPSAHSCGRCRDRLRRAATAENVVSVDPDRAALRADFGEDSDTP